ncbi:uncharacterized protein [Chanodichthys erythropterus]|uniref:uncharacterized protein n=1 Tax=Chanodichthys erythropterus TaxID=933992 RepID=UPI00351DDABB
MKFTLFTAFLFSVWMNAADGDVRPPDCCLTVLNTRVPFKIIVDYTIQEPPICPIRAVRFYTRTGYFICSDPDNFMVKKAMAILNKRMTKKTSKKSTINLSYKKKYNKIDHSYNYNTQNTGPETETSESTTDHPDCCLTVTNTRTEEDIVDYHIQDSSLCPIRAVRFHTIKNEIICSDPSDSWAIRVMKALTNGASTESSLEQHLRLKATSTAKDCCSTVTKNKPAFHEIVDYRVQETPLCSVTAVLFITAENNTICSSPTEEWVQDYIQNLNRRKTHEQTDKREFAINNFCDLKEQVENFCIKQP